MPEPETVRLTVLVIVFVPLPDLVWVKVGVSDGDAPKEIEDVVDDVGDAEMVVVADFVGVSVFEAVLDGVSVFEGVTDGVLVLEAVLDGVLVLEAVLLVDGVLV